jgi:hypothetical protein
MEKRTLRLFQNSVPRKTFEAKMGDVTGGSRKVHKEEIHSSYSLSNMVGKSR